MDQLWGIYSSFFAISPLNILYMPSGASSRGACCFFAHLFVARSKPLCAQRGSVCPSTKTARAGGSPAQLWKGSRDPSHRVFPVLGSHQNILEHLRMDNWYQLVLYDFFLFCPTKPMFTWRFEVPNVFFFEFLCQKFLSQVFLFLLGP